LHFWNKKNVPNIVREIYNTVQGIEYIPFMTLNFDLAHVITGGVEKGADSNVVRLTVLYFGDFGQNAFDTPAINEGGGKC